MPLEDAASPPKGAAVVIKPMHHVNEAVVAVLLQHLEHHVAQGFTRCATPRTAALHAALPSCRDLQRAASTLGVAAAQPVCLMVGCAAATGRLRSCYRPVAQLLQAAALHVTG
eukprot:366415-Chlamydomonas_euryale.AAC.2